MNNLKRQEKSNAQTTFFLKTGKTQNSGVTCLHSHTLTELAFSFGGFGSGHIISFFNISELQMNPNK